MKKFVFLIMTVLLITSVQAGFQSILVNPNLGTRQNVGLGNGTALVEFGTSATYHYDGSSLNSFHSGSAVTKMAGTGNGKGLVSFGNYLYNFNGTGIAGGLISAALGNRTYEGLGNGTSLIEYGSIATYYHNGSTLVNVTSILPVNPSKMTSMGDGSALVSYGNYLYDFNGTGKTQVSLTLGSYSNVGLGNGTALIDYGAPAMYYYNGSALVNLSSAGILAGNAGKMTGMGDGTALVSYGDELYYFYITGRSLVDSTLGTYSNVGLGNGTALIDGGSAMYYFNGSTLINLSDMGILSGNADKMTGLGDGTALVSYGDNLYHFVVPEPATIAILGFGGLLLLRRKK